ncbi:hypothetical protein F5880DRAFT_1510676 [Lentinula raphanica]|nr:hypothetical protein F5880DRAFT_1510676 [Lentinula raphanica]
MTRLTRLTLRAILMLGVLSSGVLAAPALTPPSKEPPTDSVEAHHQCSDPQIGASATAAVHALRTRGNCFSPVKSYQPPKQTPFEQIDDCLKKLDHADLLADGPTNIDNVGARILKCREQLEPDNWLPGIERTEAKNRFRELYEAVSSLSVSSSISGHDLEEAKKRKIVGGTLLDIARERKSGVGGRDFLIRSSYCLRQKDQNIAQNTPLWTPLSAGRLSSGTGAPVSSHLPSSDPSPTQTGERILKRFDLLVLLGSTLAPQQWDLLFKYSYTASFCSNVDPGSTQLHRRIPFACGGNVPTPEIFVDWHQGWSLSSRLSALPKCKND